jgi:hypothetical protein
MKSVAIAWLYSKSDKLQWVESISFSKPRVELFFSANCLFEPKAVLPTPSKRSHLVIATMASGPASADLRPFDFGSNCCHKSAWPKLE